MGRAAYGVRGTKQTNAGTQSTETRLAFTSAIMHTAYTCPMHRIPEHVVRSHSNFVVGHGKLYTKTFTILACPTGHQHRQTSRCVLESITTHDYITLPSHSHSTNPHTRIKTDGRANRMSRLPANGQTMSRVFYNSATIRIGSWRMLQQCVVGWWRHCVGRLATL